MFIQKYSHSNVICCALTRRQYIEFHFLFKRTRIGIDASVWSILSVLENNWSYDSNFSKKRLYSEKNRNGKFFHSRDLYFKESFGPFWIDSDQKNWTKFFVVAIFWTMIPIFRKSGYVPREKSLWVIFSKSRFPF